MTQQAGKQLKITLVRSACSAKPKIRATVAAMGLRKLHHSVVLPDNDAVRGMVFAVKHLVEVQEI